MILSMGLLTKNLCKIFAKLMHVVLDEHDGRVAILFDLLVSQKNDGNQRMSMIFQRFAIWKILDLPRLSCQQPLGLTKTRHVKG